MTNIHYKLFTFSFWYCKHYTLRTLAIMEWLQVKTALIHWNDKERLIRTSHWFNCGYEFFYLWDQARISSSLHLLWMGKTRTKYFQRPRQTCQPERVRSHYWPRDWRNHTRSVKKPNSCQENKTGKESRAPSIERDVDFNVVHFSFDETTDADRTIAANKRKTSSNVYRFRTLNDRICPSGYV